MLNPKIFFDQKGKKFYLVAEDIKHPIRLEGGNFVDCNIPFDNNWVMLSHDLVQSFCYKVIKVTQNQIQEAEELKCKWQELLGHYV